MIRVLTYILDLLEGCPTMNKSDSEASLPVTKKQVTTQPKSVRGKVVWYLGDDTKPLDGKQN